MTQNDTERSTLDRRSALKKGALAAGVVAWTTPTVAALTPSVAGAASVTGCFPSVSWQFTPTGENCSGYPTPPNPGPGNSCCNASTLFVSQSGEASCGATCPGTATATLISASPAGTNVNGICPGLIDIDDCSGTAEATLVYSVSCPDGVTYQCTAVYSVDCDGISTLVGSPDCSAI